MTREQQFTDLLNAVCNMDKTPENKLKDQKYPVRYTYNEIKDSAKEQCFFMLLQGFAHIFPRAAQVYNNSAVNAVLASDYIYAFLNRKLYEIYKGKKWNMLNDLLPITSKISVKIEYVDSEGNVKKYNMTNADIQDYCKQRNWSLTDYYEYCELYGKEEIERVVGLFGVKRHMKPGEFIKKTPKSKTPDYDDDRDPDKIPDEIPDKTTDNVTPKKTRKSRKNIESENNVVQSTVPPQLLVSVQSVPVQPVKTKPKKTTQDKLKPVETPFPVTNSLFADTPKEIVTPTEAEVAKKFAEESAKRLSPEEIMKNTVMRPIIPPDAIKKETSEHKVETPKYVVPLTDDIKLAYIPADLHFVENIIN